MLCSLHPVSGRWQTGSHANAGRSGHRQWTHAFRKGARMTGGIRNDDGASLPRPTRRMPPVSSRSHVPRSPPTREPASRPIGQSRNDGGPRGVAHQPESRMECRSEHEIVFDVSPRRSSLQRCQGFGAAHPTCARSKPALGIRGCADATIQLRGETDATILQPRTYGASSPGATLPHPRGRVSTGRTVTMVASGTPSNSGSGVTGVDRDANAHNRFPEPVRETVRPGGPRNIG